MCLKMVYWNSYSAIPRPRWGWGGWEGADLAVLKRKDAVRMFPVATHTDPTDYLTPKDRYRGAGGKLEYVCMWVCVYVGIYICMHVRKCVHEYTFLRARVHKYVPSCWLSLSAEPT